MKIYWMKTSEAFPDGLLLETQYSGFDDNSSTTGPRVAQLLPDGRAAAAGQIDLGHFPSRAHRVPTRALGNEKGPTGGDVKEPWYSGPITVAPAKKLVSLLDTANIELLRQITLGSGSISWPQVQKICRIRGTGFGQYHDQHGGKVDQVLRAITKGEHRYLITYEDGAPEWCTDDWKDAKLEIDGPALMSLKEVFVAQPR